MRWKLVVGFIGIVVVTMATVVTYVLIDAGSGQEVKSAGDEVTHPFVGENLTDLPDGQLRDASGSPVEPQLFGERVTVLTFLYTECPFETMCPRIARKLVQAQETLPESASDQVQFVMVTLDPETDQPTVLRDYRSRIGAESAFWRFLQPSEDLLKSWTEKLLIARQEKDGELVHNMQTFVSDSSGQVKKVFRGSDWEPSAVRRMVDDLVQGGTT